MKRMITFVALLCLIAAVGCGGDTGKGINSDKDKPKPVQVEN